MDQERQQNTQNRACKDQETRTVVKSSDFQQQSYTQGTRSKHPYKKQFDTKAICHSQYLFKEHMQARVAPADPNKHFP